MQVGWLLFVLTVPAGAIAGLYLGFIATLGFFVVGSSLAVD